MKLLVLGLIAGAILIYLIYNECWKVHRCTPFPNMEKMPDKRTYGGSTKDKRREMIENYKEGLETMEKIPSFDEQANMESDYIKERGKHFGQREDDPKGIMDMDKELTTFKKLSQAGWESTDKVDLSGNIRKLEKQVGETLKETDMSKDQKTCFPDVPILGP